MKLIFPYKVLFICMVLSSQVVFSRQISRIMLQWFLIGFFFMAVSAELLSNGLSPAKSSYSIGKFLQHPRTDRRSIKKPIKNISLKSPFPSSFSAKKRIFSLAQAESFLKQKGCSKKELADIIKAFPKRNWKNPLTITVFFTKRASEIHVQRLCMIEDHHSHCVLQKKGKGFCLKPYSKTVQSFPCSLRGKIDETFFLTLLEHGISRNVVSRLQETFSRLGWSLKECNGMEFFLVFRKQSQRETLETKFERFCFLGCYKNSHKLAINGSLSESGSYEWYTSKKEPFLREFIKPLKTGRCGSGFGMRKHPIYKTYKMHYGMDFSAPVGTPIMASADGIIAKITFSKGFGNYVCISHANGYKSLYAHLKGFEKTLHPGKSIAQGDIIGYVGSTGTTTGPHLHFELIQGKTPIDPSFLLNSENRKKHADHSNKKPMSKARTDALWKQFYSER